MSKTVFLKFVVLIFLALVGNQAAMSQTSISGSTCVIAGAQYNYVLSGSFTVNVSRQWCVTNGTIVGVSGSCNSANGYTSISIVWNYGATNGSLVMSSSTDNATINVTITTSLSPGSVYTNAGQNVKQQIIPYNTIPGNFLCSAPTGAACVAIYYYQWQQSSDAVTWTDISGASNQTLSFSSPATQTMYYRRKVTSATTNTIGYSDVGTLTVVFPLTGGAISPASQTIPSGTTPVQITGSTAAEGNCGGSYLYQWQSSTDGANFTDIAGAYALNLSPSAVTTTTYFRRKVSCGTEIVYSNVATVNVTPVLVGGAIFPGSKTIIYNSSPGQIDVSNTTGGNCSGNYIYQWQSSSDNSNFLDIQSATGASYTPGNLTTPTYFRRKIVCGSETAYSSSIGITFISALQAGILTSPVGTITYNTAPGTLTATGATGGNCGGSYYYQWQSCTDNLSFTIIPNASGLSYTPGNLTSTTYYRVIQYCGQETVHTNVVVISVSGGPLIPGSITAPSTPITFNTTPGALLQIPATGGNCSGNYSYQWLSGDDGINFENIPGATSVSFTPANLVQTTYFKRQVTCWSESATTSAIQVVVNPKVQPGILVPYDVSITSNTTPGLLTANPALGGVCNGAFTYQWQQSTDGNNFTDIVGATGLTYSPGNLSSTVYFRRKVVCGSDNAYTNVCRVAVSSLSCSDVNYIRTKDILKPNVSTWTEAQQLSDISEVREVTQYFDGLGRPVQTVAKGASMATNGSSKDLVSAVAYDGIGRPAINYLPYVAVQADGAYKCDALIQQKSFNATRFPGEQFYYTQTDFESSPLNRTKGAYAQGGSWIGNNRGTSSNFWLNTDNDLVRIWNVTDVPGDFGNYVTGATNGIYPAGRLYKNMTEDEKGKQVIEFKDKEGKVILKKVQLLDNINGIAVKDDGTGRGYEGWLSTYYIYDDYGSLRAVIQPEGVKALSTHNWDLGWNNSVLLKEQCFRYEYDERGRMIMKKVPGAEKAYMIYDKRDRLVYTQDGNLRDKGSWLNTTYDELNRPVMTAMVSGAGDFTQLRTFVTGIDFSMNGTVAVQGSTYLNTMAVANRDVTTDSYRASESIEFNDGFVSETNAEFVVEIISGATSSGTASINGNPIPLNATFTALTITRYDDYPATNPKPYNTANIAKLDAGTNPNPVPVPANQSSKTKGMVTVAKVWAMLDPENISNGKWIETVNYYDDKGRVIQIQGDNIENGKEEVNTLYDFSGKVLCTYIKHYNPANALGVITAQTKIQYDVLGRVLSVQKQMNDNPSYSKTIVQNEYDVMGLLKKKTLGNNLESLTYDYNIRGWVLGANREYVKDAATNYFGFDLGYDKDGVIGSYIPQYNGNISGMVWKSKGDGEKRKYDFVYDNINRLVSANFNQWVSGSGTLALFDKSAGIDFSVSNLSYDDNGNILSMWQNGWKLGVPVANATIDKLSYTYFDNSNKLKNVIDEVNDPVTKMGDFRSSSLYMNALGTKTVANKNAYVDYDYDLNGNLVKDRNKDIGTASASGIIYNFLNLPVKITVEGKGTITYIYDALGNKLKKIVQDNSVNPSKKTVTTYMFGVYENDMLQFIGQEEGRLRPALGQSGSLTGFNADYFLKDHLGNVRMVLTDETKQDQYPAATMETASTSIEEAVYTNVNTTRVDRPAGFPTIAADPDQYPANSLKVAKVSGSGNKIGPAIVLKVMAGDRFNVKVNSWYLNTKKNGTPIQTPGTPVSVLTDLVAALTGNISSASHGTITQTDMTNVNSQLQAQSQQFLNNQNSYQTYRPKAFLNWILFDDRMQMVQNSSGFEQVPDEGVFDNGTLEPRVYEHLKTDLPVTKNGYLYIYVSNETPNIDVYFDNLQVTHVRGPILEETHYYPFGLTMQGISARAVETGGAENKKKYQQYELNSTFDINLYESFYRSHDPQLGRFLQIDPKPNYFESLYAVMSNNPIRNFDLLGDTAYSRDKRGDQLIKDRTAAAIKLKKGQINPIEIDPATGLLSVNKRAYVALTAKQKSALKPLVGMINSKEEFGINLVNKDFKPYKFNGFQIKDDKGKIHDGPSTDLYGGGFVDNKRFDPELGKETIEIYLESSENGRKVTGVDGSKIDDPNYVIQFHEFGHAYNRYVLNDTKYQGCKAIDAENEVRAINGLPLRDYDNSTHKDPDKKQ